MLTLMFKSDEGGGSRIKDFCNDQGGNIYFILETERFQMFTVLHTN